MNDLSSIKAMLARLEWIELALKGSRDQKGLLDQLDALLEDDAPNGQLGLIGRIEALIAASHAVVSNAASTQQALSEPVDPKALRSIEQAVQASIVSGAAGLDERIETMRRVSAHASEQMAQSTAKAELISRTAHETVSSAREEIERVIAQVTLQLEGMLAEVSGALSADSLKTPLRDAVQMAVREVAASQNTESLVALHQAELEKVSNAVKEDFKQFQEGFQDDLVDIQKVASDRVRKIIKGRAPSAALIELYDEVEMLTAENASLKKAISESVKSGNHKQDRMEDGGQRSQRLVYACYMLSAAAAALIGLHVVNLV